MNYSKTYSLGLESLNGLNLLIHVISDRLEVTEELLGFINDSLVFEDRSIVGEVNSGGLTSILVG